MNSMVGWFIESFGNELHVEPLVLDNNNEKAIKKLNSKIAGYISELHNLDGVYYLCFFHKSEKNKPIKSNIFVLKTVKVDDYLKFTNISEEDGNDIKYLATVYLNLKRG